MANRTMWVFNPTEADVTINAKTAPANGVASLTIDDAATAASTDLSGFLAAGCGVIRNDVSGAAGSVENIQEAGRILEQLSAQV